MRIKKWKNVKKNIDNKRYFRRVRSKYYHFLTNGAKLRKTLKSKYNLNNKVTRLRRSSVLNINVPEKFCFISDHEATITFFEILNKKLSNIYGNDLYISHENTKIIGLASSFYFDLKIREYRNRWKDNKKPINIKGRISKTKEVNNFLLSFGFLKEIGLKPKKDTDYYDIDYENKFHTFKFDGSNKERYYLGNASTGLADYFDKCFQYNGFRINIGAKSLLMDAFGEILGNAVEHSGALEPKWYVRGCYNKEDHYCKFAFINFGKTVHENLSNKDSTSAIVIRKINKVIRKHTAQYSYTSTQFNEEPLWNLMALQDGISSKRTDKGKGSTRGQGLMDVISFIDKIRDDVEVSEIALISGKSKILIDYEYPIIENRVGRFKERRKKIIFNKEKNLHKFQDPKKVIDVSGKFPGTIITGRFKINKKHLETVFGGKENGQNN